MSHLVLLGDSIFDNAAYVPRGEAVVDHVRARLPAGWKVTLLAIDGNITIDVPRQLARLPSDATHLALSVGGNDALGASGVLQQAAQHAMEVVGALAAIQERFAIAYRRALAEVKATRLPALVCTIYDAVPDLPREAVCALSLFNDVIVREGVGAGLPLLDLRFVCTERRDYAEVSPIEPSATGGAKIALGVLRGLQIAGDAEAATRVFR